MFTTLHREQARRRNMHRHLRKLPDEQDSEALNTEHKQDSVKMALFLVRQRKSQRIGGT